MELEFPKHGFPISGRSIHISQTTVDCKIFSKTVVFGHFGYRKVDFVKLNTSLDTSIYRSLTKKLDTSSIYQDLRFQNS